MSGAGSSPFGSSPYGIGSPPTSTGRAGTLLTDSVGAPQGSRYINPATRRWEFDSNGRPIGMPNAGHMVLMSLTTVLGSSAWDGGLPAPGGVIGSNFEATRVQEIQNVLKPLVDDGTIEIVSITVNTKSRPVLTTILWKDLISDPKRVIQTDV